MSLLALAMAWQWTPLSEWLEPEKLAVWAHGLADSPWGGMIAVLGFVLGSLIALPVSMMIIATALIFGPVMGFIYAVTGALSAALVTYAIGHALGRDTVHRWAGCRTHRLSERLSKRGILTVVFFRVVPLAPFTIINFVAGASSIKIRDYFIGSLLGMTPGIFAMVFFVDGLMAALREPGITRFIFVIFLGLLLLVIAALGGYWLRREKA
ncbi:DedA family protein [Nitrosococcus wardiae]|uniref:TVP38/TMEM64 family membrane protein n=2 Tax=Nitrosococcus wardiae TaxID=1814290 RepID=A0A4P7C2Y8_9GAMM|nr:DedA family protein [Nitrosococcus wardiae]